MARDLILITNDDGVGSPGLRAAVEAVRDLGEILVVAPKRQQSGAGRSLPHSTDGRIYEEHIEVGGEELVAFSIEGSPAQAVQHGVLELAARKPTLAISGINYGENLGTGITVSGTIGAALEMADFGIPCLAVSLETAKEYHYSHSEEIDFTAAAFFTRYFARCLLEVPLPFDVDILKVEVPKDATPETPWRLTRVSRQRYHHPTKGSRRSLAERCPLGYEAQVDLDTLEPDSDIHAVVVDKVVSVSPLSLDLTSRVDLDRLADLLAVQAEVPLDKCPETG